jgi:lipid-binding SYLF domain-containing protein
MKKTTTFTVAVLLSTGLLLWSPSAAAQPTERTEDQAERAARAAEVLSELMKTPDQGIPQELLQNAEAVAVIPHVIKAALGIGGRWGKGLVAIRNNGIWGPPAYIDLGGGSIGFQIGGEAADIVLVFTDRRGVESLLDSKLKLGADVSVAAGPVGRSASAGTDLRFESGVYSYSRTKGLFAGLALDGAVITIDDSANHKVYGSEISGRDILLRGKVSKSPVTAPFMTALNRYSPRYAPTRQAKAAARMGDKAAARVQTESREVARADIPRDLDDQADRAMKAATVLHDIVKVPETSIPRELMDRAYGIAVIPNVVRAAFGVGGRWGKGLLAVRTNGKWSPPVYIDLAGGSFGLQIGGDATDVVLVFTERGSVQSILDSKLKLGADASIAAGPVGRQASAGTDAKLNAAIYSYSRSKGLFAGVSLDGVVITMDDSANQKVYGSNVPAKDILFGDIRPSPVTNPFLTALQRQSPRATK